MIYFDYAATTPLDKRVFSAMEPYFADKFYNPSAIYDSSRRIKKDLTKARTEIAKIIGAKDSEIIFTSGASESNNLSIQGVMKKFPEGNIIVSAIEHDSVLKTAKNYQHKVCPVSEKGVVDIGKLAKLIDKNTVLISVMQANNEIGSVQPIKQISEIVEQVRDGRSQSGNKMPIYLHTDSAQAVNYLDIHISRLGVDMMSINGGKIYGPKGSGILFVKTGLDLEPLIYGGGQERGLRSGTENVPNIIGLAEAMKLAEKSKKSEADRLEKLTKLLLIALDKAGVDYALNGSTKKRLPNNLSLTFPGQDNERLLILLDNAGFLVATGSACSASSDELSHVLRAIGLPESDIKSTLRITFGRQTTEEEVVALANQLKNLLKT